MSNNLLKQNIAKFALDFIPNNTIIGIGTGSTINYLIEQLHKLNNKLIGAVPSSIETEKRLKYFNIPIINLNEINNLALYIDGADEVDKNLNLIKGGGGALTREKIIASMADYFICIADESKFVHQLGKFPLPIEVIPMASKFVLNTIKKTIGGTPMIRKNIITDNGNEIIDIYGLTIKQPQALEEKLNQIAGVVTNGIFANRPANKLLLATQHSIEEINN